MTAEIAILNRNAVALAADSAVTIRNPQGLKIYDTANKLFTLSKFRPVGVMVFGNADLMEVPWETIIKTYRAELGARSFKRLEDYAADFLNFFQRENTLFPRELQESHASFYLQRHLEAVKEEIKAGVDERIKTRGAIAESDVAQVVRELVTPILTSIETIEYLPCFSAAEERACLQGYNEIIEKVIADVFQELPIDVGEMKRFCEGLLCKRISNDGASGVVIAGFGEDDVFPSLLAYECELIVGNRMRYSQINQAKITVVGDAKSNASIIPFAQREMVNRFMEGIDPTYKGQIQDYLVQLLVQGYPDVILKAIGNKISEDEGNELKEQLRQLGERLSSDFSSVSGQFRNDNYISPILNTVAVLPKDELAAMAESLVNLTSFKRRVTSAEQDTVGGPIDVAVISKGDGFVWIKRKHYFDRDLNHNFFANYYRKDEVTEDD